MVVLAYANSIAGGVVVLALLFAVGCFNAQDDDNVNATLSEACDDAKVDDDIGCCSASSIDSIGPDCFDTIDTCADAFGDVDGDLVGCSDWVGAQPHMVSAV